MLILFKDFLRMKMYNYYGFSLHCMVVIRISEFLSLEIVKCFIIKNKHNLLPVLEEKIL